jgi:hypothetical protein
VVVHPAQDSVGLRGLLVRRLDPPLIVLAVEVGLLRAAWRSSRSRESHPEDEADEQ